MSAELIAAIIAASVSLITLIASVSVPIYGIHKTSADTEETLKTQSEQLKGTFEAQSGQLKGTFEAQSEQLKETLKEQSRQVDKTLAEQRHRTLNERFSTAADKLGSDKPPAVRLAGVYAMAGLADDWTENRQTCVDILCAYLRLPYKPDPGNTASQHERLSFGASREVRYTVIRVVTAHLRADAAVSWQGLNFDFTGVVFDGGDFSSAVFSDGETSFHEAKFAGGEVTFSHAQFTGGEVSFDDAQFSSGEVSFKSAQFSSGEVSFKGARFSGGKVGFTLAEFSGGRVDFGDATFLGGDGKVTFSHTQFTSGEVSFDGAHFSGGLVDFNNATFSGSNVRFSTASFEGSRVYFGYTRFSGGRVDFSKAFYFGSGEVDFTDATDWSHPPDFGPEGPEAELFKMPAEGEDRPAPPNNSQ